jgi:hypothetical protein
MDREGPETLAGQDAGRPSAEDSVTAGAAARVGVILQKAEARARAIADEAELYAEQSARSAREEAKWVEEEACLTAEQAARERVREISELQASIAARRGVVVRGLEGAALTAERLEELVAALGEAAERLLEEVVGEHAAVETGAPPPSRRPAGEADTSPDEHPDPFDGPLPEGAPMARRPSRAADARFAAVLMAIQGQDRDQVAEQLERDYGVDDCEPLLDDVFGRTPA